MMLVDTHCHLDFEAFDADRSEVVNRAIEAGVEVIVNPSIDLQNSIEAIQFSEAFENVFAAIGVHPNSSVTWDGNSEAKIKELAQHARVIAIGEIGLDFYRDRAPRDKQREVFKAQLDLAAEVDLPVIVHNREAGNDTLHLLLDWHENLLEAGLPLAERPGVLHSFSANVEMANRAIEANFMIGFTGPVTFKNSGHLRDIAAVLPLENILMETDSPFLTPHPHRGQRNEPSNVKLIAEKVAELKQISFDRLASATTENARRLFRFDKKS